MTWSIESVLTAIAIASSSACGDGGTPTSPTSTPTTPPPSASTPPPATVTLTLAKRPAPSFAPRTLDAQPATQPAGALITATVTSTANAGATLTCTTQGAAGSTPLLTQTITIQPTTPFTIDLRAVFDLLALQNPATGQAGSVQCALTGAFGDGQSFDLIRDIFLFKNDLNAYLASTCVQDADTLCLQNGRFSVEALWKTSQGHTGRGKVDGYEQTNDTGYLWFFNEFNVELVVKVLNACVQADRIQFFITGDLNADVEATVTLTDTRMGVRQNYVKPMGSRFSSTVNGAFATCP